MNAISDPDLYNGSTLSAPNITKIINAVALILQNQMQDDMQMKKTIVKESDIFFFSEEKYIRDKEADFDDSKKALLRTPPSLANIEEFINAIYDCTHFSSQCFIIGLVYINRLITFTAMPFLPENWRPAIFISLLIAQKVWDDLNYSNAYFVDMYPFFTIEEVNRLEEKFLELIEYKLIINSQLYAKYYFELSSLFKNEEFPLKPLNAEMAARLESRSDEVEKLSLGQRKSKTLN